MAKVSERSGRCSLESASVKEGREVCTSNDGKKVSAATWRKGERQGPVWYLARSRRPRVARPW